MGGIVVEHRMDQLAGRDFALDGVEKADEFAVAVALHAAAADGAVEHAERGEQGGSAVPLVIVGHGLTTPRLDRQSRLGAIERLDLPRLSPGRAPRRGPVDRHKARQHRPASQQSCWCACQMRCTERSEMPTAFAMARPVQWVAWCGGVVQVSATTRAVVCAAIGVLPGLRVLSRNRPSTPASA